MPVLHWKPLACASTTSAARFPYLEIRLSSLHWWPCALKMTQITLSKKGVAVQMAKLNFFIATQMCVIRGYCGSIVVNDEIYYFDDVIFNLKSMQPQP